jgi:hypothetical protein
VAEGLAAAAGRERLPCERLRERVAMWIFTESAFVSVVRHRERSDVLLVRARDRGSIEDFCQKTGVEAVEIETDESADYLFRVLCSEAELKAFLGRAVDELDYDNFKARVSTTRGARWHDALLEVWQILRRLQAAPGEQP